MWIINKTNCSNEYIIAVQYKKKTRNESSFLCNGDIKKGVRVCDLKMC